MADELFEQLKKYNLTISAAESVTGGKFSSLIVAENGSSNFFKGSFICYTNEYKYNILKVSKNIQIVSKEMALELAINSRKIANSSLSISFTGNSSKNGIENKPKGLIYIAISSKDTTEVVEFKSLEKERIDIIEDAAIFGIKFLLEFIKNNYK